MKLAFLLRHGKSNWDADYHSDQDRPLAPRGLKAASLVGRFLGGLEQQPEVILTSPAERARRTAELVSEKAGLDTGSVLRIRQEFYGAGPGELHAALQGLEESDSATSCAMLVGHEPTMSETVGRFVGGARVRFPTAALALIRFSTDDWSAIQFGDGELQWLVVPRTLATFVKSG